MTDKITTPVAPDVLNPAPLGPLSGDWHDDDAQVYEDDFVHADQTPQDHAGIPHTVAELPVTTRLLSRNATVGTVNGALVDPIMLFPADPNRKSLTIMSLAAALAGYRLASSKSGCFNGENFFTPAGAMLVFSLDDHTGALWAYSTDANAVSLTVAAVTV